ncbi:Txe/YoeB family toxin of Txe-Axe toxin-antitoxin module [Weissella uvarum]|uniref:hypothetical protein n=1 Tax=Weissella uvarum TaxID=1479233 RepID=UPI001960AE9F|nr:hypothetical protein [Weissella uvarum]MBM7617897.1 Txe/YoeB family toxin of Txe-Axe toxin-antitoxin module [Weissella uvarum]MCM0596105.1 hypothetical protein [Weissella uvarum]
MQIQYSKRAKKDLKKMKSGHNNQIYHKTMHLLRLLEDGATDSIGDLEKICYRRMPCLSVRLNKKDRLIYSIAGSSIRVESFLGHETNFQVK